MYKKKTSRTDVRFLLNLAESQKRGLAFGFPNRSISYSVDVEILFVHISMPFGTLVEYLAKNLHILQTFQCMDKQCKIISWAALWRYLL